MNAKMLAMSKRTQLTADTSAELRQAVKLLAVQKGLSMSKLVIQALATYPELREFVAKELQNDK